MILYCVHSGPCWECSGGAQEAYASAEAREKDTLRVAEAALGGFEPWHETAAKRAYEWALGLRRDRYFEMVLGDDGRFQEQRP